MRVGGMLTGTSSNLIVGRIGGNLGRAISHLIYALMSSGIRCWFISLPISALGESLEFRSCDNIIGIRILNYLLFNTSMPASSSPPTIDNHRGVLGGATQGYPEDGFFGFFGELHLTLSLI